MTSQIDGKETPLSVLQSLRKNIETCRHQTSQTDGDISLPVTSSFDNNIVQSLLCLGVYGAASLSLHFSFNIAKVCPKHRVPQRTSWKPFP